MEKLYSPTTIKTVTNKIWFPYVKKPGTKFSCWRKHRKQDYWRLRNRGEDLVLEIGPGMGVLTAAAAEKAAKVIAVELDHRLIPVLQDTLEGLWQHYDPSGRYHEDDLSRLNQRSEKGTKAFFCRQNNRELALLHYDAYLNEAFGRGRSWLCLQHYRHGPKGSCRAYARGSEGKIDGALSVAVQYYCEVELLRLFLRKCFSP